MAALARREVEQLEERALAHHDLARERVGLGQQALAVDAQHDLTRRAQVDEPRLQVVRVRREDRVGEHPAAQVGLGAGAVPRRHRVGRHLRRAT
ncbi:MAG: hypothetical protein MUE62_05380, partial [Burkholderiaceae bacterium]|nr:hypothetical protein [Burkholderiaceae bacterium]